MACPSKTFTNGPCSEDKQTALGYFTADACVQFCASNCQEYLYVKNIKKEDPLFHEETPIWCSYVQHYTGPNCDQNGGQTDDKMKIIFFFGWEGRCVCGGDVCGQEGCLVA